MRALQVQRNGEETEAGEASLQRQAQMPSCVLNLLYGTEVARLRMSLALTAQRLFQLALGLSSLGLRLERVGSAHELHLRGSEISGAARCSPIVDFARGTSTRRKSLSLT